MDKFISENFEFLKYLKIATSRTNQNENEPEQFRVTKSSNVSNNELMYETWN